MVEGETRHYTFSLDTFFLLQKTLFWRGGGDLGSFYWTMAIYTHAIHAIYSPRSELKVSCYRVLCL